MKQTGRYPIERQGDRIIFAFCSLSVRMPGKARFWANGEDTTLAAWKEERLPLLMGGPFWGND